jgi:hypothetical protein
LIIDGILVVALLALAILSWRFLGSSARARFGVDNVPFDGS